MSQLRPPSSDVTQWASGSSPTNDPQSPTKPRPSIYQQALDDLIGELKARRTLKPATNTSQDSRPFTVTVAAIATAVNGGLYLLSLFSLIYYAALFYLLIPTPLNVGEQDVLIGAVIYFTFLGIIQLPLSRGLLQCKYEAYWGIMGIEGFAI